MESKMERVTATIEAVSNTADFDKPLITVFKAVGGGFERMDVRMKKMENDIVVLKHDVAETKEVIKNVENTTNETQAQVQQLVGSLNTLTKIIKQQDERSKVRPESKIKPDTKPCAFKRWCFEAKDTTGFWVFLTIIALAIVVVIAGESVVDMVKYVASIFKGSKAV